jgi:RimJ/RimL family protein N-acetyltransferase
MDEITLKPMTRELCHEFFMKFENDPDVFMDMTLFSKYQYDKQKVDQYFDKHQNANRLVLMIMKSEYPIGEIHLKDIDTYTKECTLGIHMQNDSYKGKGYGTIAEKLAIQYAFDVLGMKAVNADIVLKNTRSQHIVEKLGFKYINSEGIFKYYRIEK